MAVLRCRGGGRGGEIGESLRPMAMSGPRGRRFHAVETHVSCVGDDRRRLTSAYGRLECGRVRMPPARPQPQPPRVVRQQVCLVLLCACALAGAFVLRRVLP